MTPLEFLNELWQEKPEDQHVLIWTHPDKRLVGALLPHPDCAIIRPPSNW